MLIISVQMSTIGNSINFCIRMNGGGDGHIAWLLEAPPLQQDVARDPHLHDKLACAFCYRCSPSMSCSKRFEKKAAPVKCAVVASQQQPQQQMAMTDYYTAITTKNLPSTKIMASTSRKLAPSVASEQTSGATTETYVQSELQYVVVRPFRHSRPFKKLT